VIVRRQRPFGAGLGEHLRILLAGRSLQRFRRHQLRRRDALPTSTCASAGGGGRAAAAPAASKKARRGAHGEWEDGPLGASGVLASQIQHMMGE
jgi:hypothetical protein